MRLRVSLSPVLSWFFSFSRFSFATTAPSFTSTSTSTSPAACISQPLTPIHLPIRNVSLADKSVRRGIPLSVGTPPQPLAFAPNASVSISHGILSRIQLTVRRDLNNSFLQDIVTPTCGVNDTKLSCFTLLGGLFDTGSSNTWSSTNFSSLNTAMENYWERADDLWGTDTIFMNTTLALAKSPLGLYRDSTTAMNTIGLGTNSTLLSSLVSQGAISSRSFGFTQGWKGVQAEQQMDGGLTLGGYDAARVTGKNITLPVGLHDKCHSGLVISITDIKMNFKNGTDVSLFGEQQG